ncbi:GNAT family N-acetyltransferase [Methanofollis formosanus]|uniref:GNAT family N-acetyltransferase n=1 Tax=Methanofollis formosanus TaxID=299308 RepID=A0A8G1A4A2_9EURY|nr:GNAT family N-acetyltransferase [Methanofollis formosanus]QYZ79812.1 GNAT family N-acetyltransferase [Methanofollis formosanus]
MPSKIPLSALSFVHLTSDHDVSSFQCAHHDLTEYLVEDALRNQNAQVAATYLVLYEGECAGYFTLLNDSIIKKDLDPGVGEEDYPYSHYPAIKIARLATCLDYEHRGIGTAMIIAVASIARKVSRYSGCKVITVDSKPEAEEFYAKKGFHRALKTKKKTSIPMYFYNYF